MSEFWLNVLLSIGVGAVYHFAVFKTNVDNMKEQIKDLKTKSENAEKLITVFTVKLENIEKTLEKIDKKLESQK